MFSGLPPLVLVSMFSMSVVGKLDWQTLLSVQATVEKIHTALSASTAFTDAFKNNNDVGPFVIKGLHDFPKHTMCIAEATTGVFYSTVVNNNAGQITVQQKLPIFRRSKLSEAENVSEIYAKLYLGDVLAVAPPELAHILEPGLVVVASWGIDSDRKTYAALIQQGSTASFGFAAFQYVQPCKDGEMVKDQKQLIIVGYSQQCNDKVIAKRGLLQFLFHPEAFGQIPYLASYYTGFELNVKQAIRGQVKSVKENIMTRRDNKENASKVTVDVLKAWIISTYTRCIGVLTYTILQDDQKTETYYFFVVYNASLSESTVTLSEDEPFTSILTNTEFSCMMALVDHLQPNYISEQIDQFDISSAEIKSDAEKLLYAADFAARKHTLKNRDFDDKTPFINHPFVVARAVMEQSSQLSWEVYAAIYLQNTLHEINTTQSEFDSFFGTNTSITKLVKQNPSAKCATFEFVTNISLLKNTVLQMFEASTVVPASLVEGNTMVVREPVLYSLLKERIRKKYVVKLKEKTTRPFQYGFLRSYYRGDTLHGLYYVDVEELKKDSKTETQWKTYYFNLEVNSPYAGGKAVFGEMYEYVSTITHLEDIDMETAETWIKLIGPQYQRDDYAPNGHSDVSRIVKCLEYASRKHFNYFQRRKDANDTPYINHPICVARLLIKVGGIFDIDLILAALLHDTLENTSATFEELEAYFNHKVASLVLEVTDDLSSSSDVGDKKAAQNKKAKNQSLLAVLLKLADRINNLLDFWRQCLLKYPETKRRWQFTNAQVLLDGFMENRHTIRQAEWEDPKNRAFLEAFNHLSGLLQKIITDFEMSLKSARPF